MNIITLCTTRSLRETQKDRRYIPYYSSIDYQPGDMIEIIEARKKALAIVLKVASARAFKQEIRDGSFDISKLNFSKTGPHATGIVIDHFPIDQIKRVLKNPLLYKEIKDKKLRSFFPHKRSPQTHPAKHPSATSGETLQSLSIDRYKQTGATHHTELQLFVDEARTYFGEKNRYGIGSFSYYLGLCKKIPMHDLWRIYGEAKQSRKSIINQKKLFWWKIGQYVRQE